MARRQTPPTVRRRRLAGELRRLRTAVGLTMRDVAGQTGINEATLHRIETARARPQKRTLVALLDLYQVTGELREDLLEISRGADHQGWLRPYHSELPEDYTAYISFEAESRSVRSYQSLVIPGLLQTEDYARALFKAGFPMADSEEVDRRVRARMERQSLLQQDDPLQLWAIVDEAAFRRQVGGCGVMRAQARHLETITEAPHVTLQVIPFGNGAYAGLAAGAFAHLEFPNPADPELVYIETMAGDLFLESELDIRRYKLLFEHLRASALSTDETAQLLATVSQT
ncbi:MAG: helix-turn-helix domain-containing protein [Nitriliruptorales bacterium]|nr:helix-turn-helix domain-containing protein [Nitriliruptorales bacterium]